MQRSPTFRLSLMMFLQYAVWGAWMPTAARYLTGAVAEGGLGMSNGQMGLILGTAGSIGAISAPFIAGQIADRYFATQRFLCVLLLLGAGINWVLAAQTTFTGWLWFSIAYSVVFMPTLALSNSLAFANLADAEHDFPKVRVWGTIGWIAASWAFPMIWLQSNLEVQAMPPFLAGPEMSGVVGRLAESMRFSAGISVVYAMYCLMLPHTPPKREGVEPLAFVKALGLLRRPSFAVLVLVSLLISVIHNIYFLQASNFLPSLGLATSSVGPAMTIGQFAEIVMMASLGWMLKRLGFRGVIALGIVAYIARYAIWAQTSWPASVLVASQVLHGVGYACFFAGAYIYVDRIAPVDVRHSAQTVFGILILGGGPVLGGLLAARLADAYPSLANAAKIDFSHFWLTLSGIAALALLVFLVAFRDEARRVPAA